MNQWKGTAGWLSAKGRSDVVEDMLAESLRKKDGATVITSQDKGAFSDWDLHITYPSGITVTIEVKEDKKVEKTGNVAVEIYRQLKSGIRPTCISVTKADYFAYYFDKKFHFIKTSALKALVEDKTTHFETWGGDGGISRNCIFKKQIILDNTEFIYTAE